MLSTFLVFVRFVRVRVRGRVGMKNTLLVLV